MLQSTVEIFKSIFLVERSNPYVLKNDNWLPVYNKIKFTDQLLNQHLDHKLILGQYIPDNSRVSFCCLDFDYSERAHINRKQYLNYVRKVSSIFLCPKAYFISSESNNIHCYLFFKATSSFFVEKRVKHSLLNAGFDVIPGITEVFCAKHNLRLPLGRGSRLLSPDLQELTSTKEEQLLWLDSFLKGKNLPNIYQATPSYKHINKLSKKKITEDIYSLDILLTRGLQQESTMNKALIVVANYYFLRTKGDIEQAGNLVKEWADRFHNNLSKDYNFNRQKLFNKIDKLVEWVDRNNVKYVRKLDLNVGLNKHICEFILNTFHNYTIQEQVFSIFQFIKLSVKSNNLIFLSKNFLIDKRVGIGLSNRNYQYVMAVLESNDFLTLWRRGNNYKKHCNIYKWCGLPLSSDIMYTSWSGFILETSKLNLYSKYVQAKILSKAG